MAAGRVSLDMAGNVCWLPTIDVVKELGGKPLFGSESQMTADDADELDSLRCSPRMMEKCKLWRREGLYLLIRGDKLIYGQNQN